MELKFDTHTLQALTSAVKSAAGSAAKLARTAPARAAEKAAGLKDAVQLRRAIADLQEEIDLQMQAVGEMVYATHRGTPSDSTVMAQILEYVDILYEDQQTYRRQHRALQGARFCPECGAENEKGSAFCAQCGHPLSGN